MKNLLLYIIITILLFALVSSFILIYILSNINLKNNNYTGFTEEGISELSNNNLTNNSEIITTSYASTKISPNTKLIFKTFNKKCGHCVEKEIIADENIVNKNEYEISELYKNWNIKKFTSNEVVFYKEEDKYCGEDYVVKEIDGVISIYRIDPDGNETLYKNSSLDIKYLPEDDRNNLKQGIKINGNKELNELLEDYE